MSFNIRNYLLSLTFFLTASFAGAIPFVEVGYLVPDFQILPLGSIVNIEQLQGNEDIDLTSLTDFFYIQISATEEDKDEQVVFHITENVAGNLLMDYWTQPFPLRNWFNYGSPPGHLTNSQLAQLKFEPGFWKDRTRSIEPSGADILDYLEGGIMITTVFNITFELYRVDENGNEIPWSQFTRDIQVYNPSPPQLLDPQDGDIVSGYPVYFNWELFGGPSNPVDLQASDWTLIIVEGEEGANPETVINSRTALNTRYEGPPQSPLFHFYNGVMGSEQDLTLGQWYYWMIQVSMPTVIPGEPQTYESNIHSFRFGTPLGGGALGGGALGGELDEYQDTDGDGIPDTEDEDDDGDGVPDLQDPEPLNPDVPGGFGAPDFDGDGIVDSQDEDDDNDGVPDINDPEPQNPDVPLPAAPADNDGDGIPDDEDPDDDNDGILDRDDPDPFTPAAPETGGMLGTSEPDTDHDGITDDLDTDDDNDGVPDVDDPAPLDPDIPPTAPDYDGDGIPDSEDLDIDGDGVPNEIDPEMYNDSIPGSDFDEDGISNADDPDDDNDGTLDADDPQPYNPDIPVSDFDGDGSPDNVDTDDDNDGTLDVDDPEPFNPDVPRILENPDFDGDGIPDNQDTDDDNDGVLDEVDSEPLNANMPPPPDFDGDGIPDSIDDDDDNDGTLDVNDPEPFDSSIPAPEEADFDGDGIPDSQDTDDDNDGVLDADDPEPLNPDIPATQEEEEIPFTTEGVMQVLNNVLDVGQITALADRLEGYSPTAITFSGEGEITLDQLIELLNNPDLEIKSTVLDEN